MRPSGNTPTANFNLDSAEPLLSGYDTVHVGYYGQVSSTILEAIEANPDELTICGVPFTIKRQARGVYRTTLYNELISVSLDNCINSPNTPQVFVQMQSFFLSSLRLPAAHQKVLELLREIFDGGIIGEKVSRVDLYADIGVEEGFTKEDLDRFITRAKKRDLHMDGKVVSGFSFGRGALTARTYDKSLEVRESRKDWLFDRWGCDREAKVCRVEYQIRRRTLSRFHIESIADLVSNTQSLWNYCTHWLSMRAEDNKIVTRRSLTPLWKKVQAVRFKPQAEIEQIEPVPFVQRGDTDEQTMARIVTALKTSARYRETGSTVRVLESLLPRLVGKL